MAPVEANLNPAHPSYDPIIGVEPLADLANKLTSFKAKTDKWYGSVIESAQWCREKILSIGDFLAGVMELVAELLHNFIAAIDDIMEAVKGFVKIVRLINAFVCGALVEIYGMIAAIFDLMAMLLYLAKNKEGSDRMKKTIEKLVAQIKERPSIIIDEIKKAFENLTERYSEDKGEYQVAYNLGADVVTVLLWVDFMVAIVKAFKNLPKLFRKLRDWVERVGKKFRKPSYSDLLDKWDEGVRVSGRSRRFGQKILKKDLARIKSYLDDFGFSLELHPAEGSVKVEGFFAKNGEPFLMPEGAQAIFIYTSKKGAIVLREGATYYEFFHEFMHVRHARELELNIYTQLGGRST